MLALEAQSRARREGEGGRQPDELKRDDRQSDQIDALREDGEHDEQDDLL